MEDPKENTIWFAKDTVPFEYKGTHAEICSEYLTVPDDPKDYEDKPSDSPSSVPLWALN
ncbi:hypothetical protein GO755_39065 [Spirosoma sp. HMF4905]|uniref:Uncharacterized protein n=1 Tax=Spirosoma arboris TaxID=2682092 RepID=A0A7K1SQQ7_9BACT|nr:hypothetical protein [Spirosoma arboris]MVM36080.1 hypothetical protein [Spirosoma arboris]